MRVMMAGEAMRHEHAARRPDAALNVDLRRNSSYHIPAILRPCMLWRFSPERLGQLWSWGWHKTPLQTHIPAVLCVCQHCHGDHSWLPM
jgi:hypothetical protein